jgi:4-amino-4-deoxy-L-arabinose transferase-like glycosyltransferase
MAIGGRYAGWLAVGALLGVFHFWLSASEARVDLVFAACITVSLAGFFFWQRRAAAGAAAGRGARAACYLGAACAVLAKGPAGLVLPGLVIAGFLAWQRELALLRRLWSWPLAAAVLLLDLGWYGLAVRAGGEEFVAVQLLYENVDRFLGRDSFARHAADPGFRHSPLRMPLEFARHFFPWDLVLVSAARRAASGEREDAAGRLLHVWWITILVFFTLASGKRSVYLLPAAPAIALLAGRALAALAAGGLTLHLPSALRRHPAPGLLAAVALFDLSIAAAGQAVRQHRSRRDSLAEFADRTAALVPADAPLYAARDLGPPAILVLAYRLGRAIAREPAGCTAGAYVLVPGPQRARHQGRVLLSTVRAHESVALVRVDDEGACRGP